MRFGESKETIAARRNLSYGAIGGSFAKNFLSSNFPGGAKKIEQLQDLVELKSSQVKQGKVVTTR